MLALICGEGDLPGAVARAQDSPPLVCVLSGFAPRGLDADLTFRIETLGSLLEDLRHRGVTRICLCGRIRRPEVELARIDAATLPLVARLHAALQEGDDGALRAVMAIFEEAGFTIVAAHEAAPGLLPESGVPTELTQLDSAEADARAGEAALKEMGAADLGQACVVRDGRVVAREDARGTDAMLRDVAQGAGPGGGEDATDPASWMMDRAGDLLGAAADWLSGPAAGRSGLLYKAPKPGQDRRADLPTIGPATARAAARAGLTGIVIEAGGVIVLDLPRLVGECDRAGLFLWVREPRA